MKQPLVVGLCLLGCVLIAGLAKLMEVEDSACSRIESKIELANEFCDGLAERAAKERCQSLSDDVDVMGQCMQVIVPAAHSSCMGYLNMERMKQQYSSLCER